MGDQEKALEYYNQAAQIDPNNVDLYYNLGEMFYQQRDFDKALEQFLKGESLDSTDVEILVRIAEIKDIQEKWEETIKYLYKIVEIIPEAYMFWGRLSDLFR